MPTVYNPRAYYDPTYNPIREKELDPIKKALKKAAEERIQAKPVSLKETIKNQIMQQQLVQRMMGLKNIGGLDKNVQQLNRAKDLQHLIAHKKSDDQLRPYEIQNGIRKGMGYNYIKYITQRKKDIGVK